MTKNYTWQVGSGRPIELRLTLEQAESCTHQGDCTADVDVLLPELETQTSQWDTNDLREELHEYGAWDDGDLQEDAKNIQRMVWISCCDIKENSGDYASDSAPCTT